MEVVWCDGGEAPLRRRWKAVGGTHGVEESKREMALEPHRCRQSREKKNDLVSDSNTNWSKGDEAVASKRSLSSLLPFLPLSETQIQTQR